MSGGISTNAPFAVLKLKRGLDLDTYKTYEELASAALYQHAIACHEILVQPGGQPFVTDAALCDAYLLRLQHVYETVRAQVVAGTDPARLRAPEVWPFCMADSSQKLYSDKWYGFSDSGGLYCTGAGFASREDAVKLLTADIDADDWSTEPNLLGSMLCSILSGREYVDRLYVVCRPGGSGWPLDDYGHWSEPAKELDTERRYLLATAAQNEDGTDSDCGYMDVLSWATQAEILAYFASLVAK